jgi:hypothetical protein
MTCSDGFGCGEVRFGEVRFGRYGEVRLGRSS